MAASATNGTLQRFQSLFRTIRPVFLTNKTFTRKIYSKELKKFYKNAAISQYNGIYEINLDKRKLRTPLGNVFNVPNESLALAVATEWNSQKDTIKKNTMHLTTLCNTAIDNPIKRTKKDLTRVVLHFLETDTLCYRITEPEDLFLMQQKNWDPVVDWFRNRYNVQIETTTGFNLPVLPEETINELHVQLLSYNFWSLTGICHAVECVKSLILTMALIERQLTVEEAVYLSRLEMEFQAQKWGNVEWYHDLDMYDNQTRLSAAALFTNWCSESSSMKQKATVEFRGLQ